MVAMVMVTMVTRCLWLVIVIVMLHQLIFGRHPIARLQITGRDALDDEIFDLLIPGFAACAHEHGSTARSSECRVAA